MMYTPLAMMFLSPFWSSAAQIFAGHNASTFATRCKEFRPLEYVSNTTLNSHEYVPAGTTIQYPNNDISCNRPNQTVTVDICRLALNVSTSARSFVLGEVWLPEKWEHRFLATGNGGIDGCTKYEDINYGVKYGFSTVGANNGHNGTGGTSFLHNEEVLKDYVYRSLHIITELGKKLTNGFYSTPIYKSYYIGCSGGGRQGLNAAERFPEDYDGIVIGDPALNFNNMSSWRASFFGKTGAKNSTNFIPPALWKGLIHQEVLRQCDTIDGVADGIIEDPRKCDFRPEALICGTKSDTKDNCLTSVQVEIVRSLLSPLHGASGEVAFPAMQPGGEERAADGLYNGSPFPYSLDWFRYVIHNTSTWDPITFTTTDITLAQTLNPFNVQTNPSVLSPNTKILLYHGLQDQQITSYTSDRFYTHLSASMSLPPSKIDDFLRYFRIPGMFHCNSGPGAWMIGQSSVGNDGFESEKNVLAATVRWVEENVAPEVIGGRKYVGDEIGRGLESVRQHCRWPFVSTYVGGDASLAESWKCK